MYPKRFSKNFDETRETEKDELEGGKGEMKCPQSGRSTTLSRGWKGLKGRLCRKTQTNNFLRLVVSPRRGNVED